jgi:hypothetical protein
MTVEAIRPRKVSTAVTATGRGRANAAVCAVCPVPAFKEAVNTAFRKPVMKSRPIIINPFLCVVLSKPCCSASPISSAICGVYGCQVNKLYPDKKNEEKDDM